MQDFGFHFPVSVFEKAGAPQGRERRIGGIISTENPDRQREIVLQSGLDFREFVDHGWFNDNHSRDTDAAIGYPELVRRFNRGDSLPDGSIAATNGTWAEGYLLKTKRADRIWELGQALKGTGRNLGFSVEGSIQKRVGPGRRTIAKATVRNVAVTNCPVNTDSRLDILAKSLSDVLDFDPESLDKALGMGTAGGPPLQPAGPQSGSGAGQVLARESLETNKRVNEAEKKKKKKPVWVIQKETETKKSLTTAEAVAWVQERIPAATPALAGRIVNLTLKKGDFRSKTMDLKAMYGADDNQEYDEEGNAVKGGGYYKKAGKMCKMAKSVTADELEKSIAQLEDYAAADAPSRKQLLLEKAQSDDLSKAEKEELFGLLGGGHPEAAQSDTAERITKSLQDEPLQKAVDVSAYLREHHDALTKSLEAVADEIQKSDHRRHEFSMLQAKALVDIGVMVKSMADQLDGILDQPVRGPKSMGANGAARPMQKSFAGQAGEELSKSQVLDALEEIQKSDERVNGERVDLALAKYESTNMISPKMLAAVKEQLNGAAH